MAYPRITVFVVLISVLSAVAVGQQATPVEDPSPVPADEPQLVDLRVVDQGIEDRGGIATSLRQHNAGLHQANDFAKVYESTNGDGFMRVQGALRAVYPRAFGGGGGSAAIPPGTVFYIGESSPFDLYTFPGNPQQTDGVASQASPGNSDALRWNTRLNSLGGEPSSQFIDLSDLVADASLTTPRTGRQYHDPTARPLAAQHDMRVVASDTSAAPDIVADESYRQRRLRELMQRAAQASRLRH